MERYDVFNGDADGICALLQLRLEADHPAHLITGAKRDIWLLDRVPAKDGDEITVLDISLDANRAALDTALSRGAGVQWFDHHYAGRIPSHPRLLAMIDPSPAVCTSVLVDRFLHGRQRAWAVVAAFGDNLPGVARAMAATARFDDVQVTALQQLGEVLNYNAYGESVADLHFRPDHLYRRLKDHRTPYAFVAEAPEFNALRDGFTQDLALAQGVRPFLKEPWGVIYVLPESPWARRVSGTLSNRLTNANGGGAVAVLTGRSGGGYVVSVRAPRTRPDGADALCRQFDGGGGRKSAAGINHLPESEFDRFVDVYRVAFCKSGAATAS